MANDVYLSSTLNDLVAEREAVTAELVRLGFGVKQSYSASEQDLITSCLEDVAQCRIYIGLVADRYGYRPPDAVRNRHDLSITELEFQKARAEGLHCFVFIKHPDVILRKDTDLHTGENDRGGRIENFRQRLQSPPLPRPGQFKSTEDLQKQVLTAVLRVKVKGQPGSIFESDDPHPAEMTTDVALVVDALGLDDIDTELSRRAQADPRFRLVQLDPATPDYLTELEARCARCRAVAWHFSSRSLALHRERGTLMAAALASQRQRRGAVGVLLSGSAVSAQLPADWPVDVVARADDTLRQAFDDLHRGLRQRVPAIGLDCVVGVPLVVLAMTATEAATLADPQQAWQDPAIDAQERDLRLGQLSTRVAALRAQPAHAQWPAGAYGDRREDWRPFGAGQPSAGDFLQQALGQLNRQHSRRDRVFIRNAQTRLVPHAYRVDDLLQPAHGSDTLLRRVRDRGCLVLVDELSLLHPQLRRVAGLLLKGENVAVLASHPIDPAPEPIGQLLGAHSWLDVGLLISRFADDRDPRCELAISSPERLRRWLLLALPELVGSLGGGEAQGSLVERVDELFKPTATAS